MSMRHMEQLYGSFMNELERTSRGAVPSHELSNLFDRMDLIFMQGFVPKVMPSDDFSARVTKNLILYAKLMKERKSVEVAGASRPISTELEAYKHLRCVQGLIDDVAVPFLKERGDFPNKLFRELYNLGLASLESVVNGVADEFIGEDEAPSAKMRATDLARTTSRMYKHYLDRGLDFELGNLSHALDVKFSQFPSNFLRGYETVVVAPKKIARKRQCLDKIKADLTGDFTTEKFVPNLVLPVAQGGNELGIELANMYEDLGHQVLAYPLMYSIKTRNQRRPWIENDQQFLREVLPEQNGLVAEDWVTTGNTVRGLMNSLQVHLPHDIRIATIKRDPEQSTSPHLNVYQFYVGEFCRYTGNKNDSIRKS